MKGSIRHSGLLITNPLQKKIAELTCCQNYLEQGPDREVISNQKWE